jgi:hypothetical protein
MALGAEDVAREILRIRNENPQAFNTDAHFWKTLQEVQKLDKHFKETGGVFFHVGSSASDTAEEFTRIHVEQYRETGRPSLPALALHHAERMGLNKGSADYKALIMVAVRAEMKLAVTPDYHNKFHYTDVAAMTANLLEENNKMLKAGTKGATDLSKHEQALTLIAAIGHDLDHDGHSNPADDLLFNESKSFELMFPLLEKAGLSGADIGKIHTILMATSPDGPDAVLQAVAQAMREGKVINPAAKPFSQAPLNKFPALTESLRKDPRLVQMAAIVHDADLYGSTAKLNSSVAMSGYLTTEMNKAGVKVDLTTDQAREGFLKKVKSYTSNVGRAVAGKSLNALRRETKQRIARQQKPSHP